MENSWQFPLAEAEKNARVRLTFRNKAVVSTRRKVVS
jgi:hypothetical protein